MSVLNFRNISNIILISVILILSYLEIDTIIKDSNGLIFIGVIDVLVIILLIVNLFSRKTVIKEVEVVKEVFVNDENTEGTEIFEMIEDKEESRNLIVTSKDESQNNENYTETQLINMSKQFDFAQAVFYLKNEDEEFVPISTYAFYSDNTPETITEGDGILGQAIKDKKMLCIDDIPDGYITVLSGLGKGNPRSLLIVPAIIDNKVVAVAEIASLNEFNEEVKNIINESVNKIAENIINVH